MIDNNDEGAGRAADLPVVISSGYISEELRSGAERLKVRHLLQKQDTAEELVGLLRRVLAP